MKANQTKDTGTIMEETFPGYPCNKCASYSRCTDHFKKCTDYRSWLHPVLKQLTQNIRARKEEKV